MSQDAVKAPPGNPGVGIALDLAGKEVQFGPGLAFRVSAQQNAHINSSAAVGMAAGTDAEIKNSSAFAIAVGRDLAMTSGSGRVIAVGRDLNLKNGSAVIITPGKDAQLSHSNAMVLPCQQAKIEHGRVGVVLARQVELSENSRVLASTPQVLAFGAAFGAATGILAALLVWLLRRK